MGKMGNIWNHFTDRGVSERVKVKAAHAHVKKKFPHLHESSSGFRRALSKKLGRR